MMKKKICKALFVTFAVMMMLTLIGISISFAAENFTAGYYTYTVVDGEAKITDVDNSISGKKTIPSTLGGYPVTSIGEGAFYECESLSNVIIPNSVLIIDDYAFSGCISLENIIIPDSVVYIGDYVFLECEKLESITIPNSVKIIGKASFSLCKNLVCVTIPNSVTSIGDGAFYKCCSLEVVTIPNSVTSVGEAVFYGCKSLRSVIIPDSVTNIAKSAFYGCTSLENITIPKSVIDIGESAFYDCTSLRNVTILALITHISEDLFSGCTSLENITIGNSVTSIAARSFYRCTKLEKITIPDSVTNIGALAFSECTNLESIIIGKSVESIALGAFYCCLNLESITISDSLINIDKYAFDGCNNIKNVYYTGTKAQWKNIDIDSYNDSLLNATIHYNYCNHKYTTTTTKATLSQNGSIKTACTVCGDVKSTKTISSPKTFTLSSTSYTYNGNVRKPTVTVKDSAGKTLVNGTDYTVTYAEGRKNVGTYKVTVKMKGNYTGTKTLSFKINPINISKCTVKLSATSFTYNGNVRNPYVTVTTANGTKLTKDTHYTVTYASGRKNVGTYKVTVKMKGNYTGTKTLSFKINPINISKCTVKLSATSFTYNGNVRNPYVTVTTANGIKLTKDTHYTVTYATGRKNVGTYKVTVKMKGNYTGTKTLTFKILPQKTTISKLTAGTKKITVNLTKKTTQVTGYQIQYATNKNFTNAKTKTLTSNSTVKTTLSSLTANKTYYVRVRTYKTVNDVKYYSDWSASKYVKTK